MLGYGIVPMAKDEYALAKDKVRYIGDDVAAVCAIDPEIAEEARKLLATVHADQIQFAAHTGIYSPDACDQTAATTTTAPAG